jgi:nucleoside phosphorylase
MTTLLVPRGPEAAAVRRGAAAGARIVEIRAGAAAAEAAAAVQPGASVVVLGICGALRDLRVGDVVTYRSVADASGALPCEPVALAGARIVNACTTDHVVTRAAERRVLAERYDASVVDMEGTHLARALAARGMRAGMVRVVSDDPQRDLPAIEGVIRPDGSLDAVGLARAFIRDPRDAFAFVRDVQRALRVLARVASSLTQT